MTSHQEGAAAFRGYVDLAAEGVGGKALAASDEFFAAKENLLKTGRGVFIADKFTERGKWMDGWETRRKRSAGHDWCIIRLGLPGILRGFDIDTNHFLGNHPPYASVEALRLDEGADEDAIIDGGDWTEVLPRSPLAPGSQNMFPSYSDQQWTHLKLHIYPAGGVARFRAYGDVVANIPLNSTEPVDLVAMANGGRAVACSDMFFSPMDNLILPGRAENMGQGWESRRRRGPGHDWVILRMGRPGLIEKIEVDTNHFKGNYPDRCSIDGCYAPGEAVDLLTWSQYEWTTLMEQQKLGPHERHYFEDEIVDGGPFSHVRLNIYPDGGVSRLRVYGRPEA